ncbi:acyl-CoA dehydrogenase family protein [Phototrophicus methaneseepsis]|uniref:Acyl-CoA dehydrogenase family protein n=1 Tax=Phototrophicus methaneseepsis TaxID=2710758 RepID=A0A7S8E9C1_9CHLR|nr:acyl-CoA dehydrogenase family protein [Phototrophicus methaneseepsis]QPC82765.1 acyl-CoA dehydrogenase family protein [Phototrophicus methaneseepsis]
MAAPVSDNQALYEAFDYYNFDSQLTEKQKATRDKVRAFMQEEVIPHINPYWEKAEFPWEIARKIPELGIIGGPLAGLDFVEVGLIAYELAKGDGSIGTFYGVHSGLAIGTIGLLASDEQKARWLPEMLTMEKIGAFGLTEPNVGSNAVGIQTHAKKDGDSFILNGAKRWIGNASISDLLIIWARDENGTFCGFVIEDPQNTPGLTIKDIWGKVGKRSVLNADITLENVRVPAENRLEKVSSFRHTAQVLGMGRYGVSWEAAGVAAGALEYALKYAKEREQFGKPIGAFQLIQAKLVEMAAEVTSMQALCMQLSRLMTNMEVNEGILSLAKYNNARKARLVTSLARETLGGNGILIDNHIARLWTDAEVIYTYEGSNEINLLIVGRDLTGENAIV